MSGWGALAASLAAFGTPQIAMAQTGMLESTPNQQRPKRDIQFTVPLVYEGQVLGDVLLTVKPDNSVEFDPVTLREQLDPLLNESGKSALNTLSQGKQVLTPSDLALIGIEVEFNSGLLQVDVRRIAGKLRPPRQIIDNTPIKLAGDIPLLEPAHFSAYLNLNTDIEYLTDTKDLAPELFLDGATRLGKFALEYDAAISDQLGDGTRFYRRGVRAVYDQREKYRRFAAGDLRLDTLSLLRTPVIGGISVEKSRRVFDPYLPAARLGAGQIFLDNNSQVDVIINGSPYQTLELDAGTYDLASLPVQLGSNDVELRIRDSGGREQTVNLDFFYQPLDLIAGEEEYTFAVGMIARELTFQPNYTNDPVAIGSYRKALNDDLILGGALQISKKIQLVGAEAVIVPQVIPGYFTFEGATSFTKNDKTGVAARASYRVSGGSSYLNRRSFSLNVDYTSAGFNTISNLIPTQFNLLTLSASYNQTVSARGRISSGALYSMRGGPLEDVTSIFVDYIHRVTDRLQFSIGGEYGSGGGLDKNWGVRLNLNYRFGANQRASADYRSRSGTFNANLTRTSENYVGSYGYDVGITRDPDQTRADLRFDYVGNRFDTRISMYSQGDNFGKITNNQRLRFQAGTSLAIADGTFAVGRPIRDAFAIAYPHESLKNGEVVVGRDLSDNHYEARSGTFGGALQGRLSSYSEQTIQYDVDGAEVGYDIGEGVARVDPPYRGGYKFQIGNDYFVSIVGTLNRGGEPLGLIAGRVEALDDEKFEPKPFFTNSVGRFGLIGFAPGKKYRVTFDNGKSSFEFTVPPETEGLFKLGVVNVPETEQ